MNVPEILQTLVVSLFAIAFGLWAKRLDKVIDLLDRIQAALYKDNIKKERRLTRLEVMAGLAGAGLEDNDE